MVDDGTPVDHWRLGASMQRTYYFLQVLAPFNKEINVNDRVRELYIDHLLPRLAAEGDDNNYGSSAMYDVLALQVGFCTHVCSF